MFNYYTLSLLHLTLSTTQSLGYRDNSGIGKSNLYAANFVGAYNLLILNSSHFFYNLTIKHEFPAETP